jgi:hypothetical protein
VLVNRRIESVLVHGVSREKVICSSVCVCVCVCVCACHTKAQSNMQLTDAYMHAHKVKPTCTSIRVCVGCVLCFQSG